MNNYIMNNNISEFFHILLLTKILVGDIDTHLYTNYLRVTAVRKYLQIRIKPDSH